MSTISVHSCKHLTRLSTKAPTLGEFQYFRAGRTSLKHLYLLRCGTFDADTFWKQVSNKTKVKMQKKSLLTQKVSIKPAIFLFLSFFLFLILIWLHQVSVAVCRMSVSWPGIDSRPPALGLWNLSHWTTREAPYFFTLNLFPIWCLLLGVLLKEKQVFFANLCAI